MEYPTAYRVSTITATGALGCLVDLDKFFQNINLEEHPNILYVEYGKRKFDKSYCKGQINKVIQMGTKSKRFDNQVTILYKDLDTGIYVSAKVFRNGNLQMTGIKHNDQGILVMNLIRDVVITAYRIDNAVLPNYISELVASQYSVRLINSDFKMGFPIRRDILYKTMMKEYEHGCSYEPCIYPGVKIQYFYNKDKTSMPRDGICRCASPCIYKKKGNVTGCRKITIAVFQSGSVIMTGAQHLEQIDEVYKFITKVLLTHENTIKKVVLLEEPVLPSESGEKVMIKKKNIVYHTSRLL